MISKYLLDDFILSSVDGGHRAVIFDRFQGVKPDVIGEGTHFLIPWVQRPVIFDIRSRPRNVPTITGSKGMACIFYLLENEVAVGIQYENTHMVDSIWQMAFKSCSLTWF